MIIAFKPVSIVRLSKQATYTGLVLYSIGATYWVWINKPKTILIGITPHGTYVIEFIDEKTRQHELRNFIINFINRMYHFDSDTYINQVSKAGDFLSEKAWSEYQHIFSERSKKLKSYHISQTVKILDIRIISDFHLQADIELHSMHHLKTVISELRVEIELKHTARSTSNPYPYEIDKITEDQMK